ncbi:hypothetical protein D1631_00335 [Chryseobacterium nematophagum]|uniref:Uncharacterized protein n=1 Tax=Chryseobacterium nematophagum TaxID=2305228 RepID=A0A3M7TL08_9FLAO|nr:hypothetical protein D1631_00335 [Chryseobacterium nematophagum]
MKIGNKHLIRPYIKRAFILINLSIITLFIPIIILFQFNSMGMIVILILIEISGFLYVILKVRYFQYECCEEFITINNRGVFKKKRNNYN